MCHLDADGGDGTGTFVYCVDADKREVLGHINLIDNFPSSSLSPVHCSHDKLKGSLDFSAIYLYFGIFLFGSRPFCSLTLSFAEQECHPACELSVDWLRKDETSECCSLVRIYTFSSVHCFDNVGLAAEGL